MKDSFRDTFEAEMGIRRGDTYPQQNYIDWLEIRASAVQRDELAAMAMQGELASPTLGWSDDVYEKVACSAYRFADAMQKARNTK